MGYVANQTDAKFFISAKDFDSALTALKKKQAYLSDYNDLVSALDDLRWGVDLESIDTFGPVDIIDIHFAGEKIGDDIEIFKTIAPYVKKGSYIQFCGEDGEIWRWTFDGKKCKRVYPKIKWEE